jgi:hypothetical protein
LEAVGEVRVAHGLIPAVQRLVEFEKSFDELLAGVSGFKAGRLSSYRALKLVKELLTLSRTFRPDSSFPLSSLPSDPVFR